VTVYAVYYRSPWDDRWRRFSLFYRWHWRARLEIWYQRRIENVRYDLRIERR
jgi:hypothetical protein